MLPGKEHLQVLEQMVVRDRRCRMVRVAVRPYEAQCTQQLLRRLCERWRVFDHLACSPDLAPSNYHLFQLLKRFLAGYYFPSNNEVQTAITLWLNSPATVIFSTPVCRNWSRGMTCDPIHLVLMLRDS
ncbi:hypothetical protein AVEN_15450-1 [Araneus ventricosus]|uniref:Uncharacterized protein n=1 Tax=Araneus ventricosus TaxID=182803 RepID=A0A4Y2EC37_ARAVE|nr:hypothetical protein AVEN_15450-1 [Araneus ventricosus]